MRPLITIVATLAFLLAVKPTSAQGSRSMSPLATVGLDIRDSSGAVRRALALALRELPGIEVVPRAEFPRYLVSGTVECQPDCADPSTFVVALRFSSPVMPGTAAFLARGALGKARVRDETAADSATALMWEFMKSYERPHDMRAFRWATGDFELRIREYVGRLDSMCFERWRSLDRAIASDAPNALSRHKAFEASRRWICD